MDAVTGRSSLERFSPEIQHMILSFLDQGSLKTCRLLNQYFGSMANAYAFRCLRLTKGDDLSAERFMNVATSDKLCRFVRQVKCNSSSAVDIGHHKPGDKALPNANLDSYEEYVRALPYLQSFVNLTDLDIHFNYRPAEAHDVKYALLATIFHSVAGCWSVKRQRRIEKKAGFQSPPETHVAWPWVYGRMFDITIPRRDKITNTRSWASWRSSWEKEEEGQEQEEDGEQEDYEEGEDEEEDEEEQEEDEAEEPKAIELQRLTVTHLGDFQDSRLEKSEAFRTVMQMPSLKVVGFPMIFRAQNFEMQEDDMDYVEDVGYSMSQHPELAVFEMADADMMDIEYA